MKNISSLQNQTNSVSLWRTLRFIRWGLGEYCITLWEYSNWTTILRLCCFRQCSIKIYWKKKIDAVVRGGLLGGWMWVGGWKETPWCWSPGMRHARKLARLAPNQMPSVPPPHPTSTTTTTSTTLPLLSHECHVPSPTPPFSPHSSLSLSLLHSPWNRRAAISASSDRISDHSAQASGQTAFLPPAAAAVAGRLLQRASRIDLWRPPGY